MSSKIFSLAILALISLSSLHAQLSDRMVPRIGFSYEFVRYEVPGATGEPVLQTLEDFYNVHVGSYFTLFEHNDIISFGADAALQAGVNFVTLQDRLSGTVQTKVPWVVQIPLFMMAKVGANSTAYNSQAFGVGFGFGAQYNYLSQFGLDASGSILNIRAGFINPSAAVEATLRWRGSPVTARFHFAAIRPESVLSFERTDGSVVEENLRMGNFGISLLYPF
ncbi:MAG: hypothetical protein AAFV07_20575 [Bacteroidota bacterium]